MRWILFGKLTDDYCYLISWFIAILCWSEWNTCVNGRWVHGSLCFSGPLKAISRKRMESGGYRALNTACSWLNHQGRTYRGTGVAHLQVIDDLTRSNTTENIQHSMDDTLKQLESTANALKQQINTYKSASYDTIKKQKTYGIQVIQNAITLTETSIMSPTKWRFIELRSATIPVAWAKRHQMIKLFELIATLHVSSLSVMFRESIC